LHLSLLSTLFLGVLARVGDVTDVVEDLTDDDSSNDPSAYLTLFEVAGGAVVKVTSNPALVRRTVSPQLIEFATLGVAYLLLFAWALSRDDLDFDGEPDPKRVGVHRGKIWKLQPDGSLKPNDLVTVQ
jgi:hypothetical protein